MLDPLVSIVIPVYNVEDYLEKCVNSVINQSYKNIEIILVDDGSSDNSGKICDKFAGIDSRISVIHKSNEGAGLARNIGINRAKGKYIGFIDSDDYISEHAVEKCVVNAERECADVVLFDRCAVSSDGTVQEKFFSNQVDVIYGEKNLLDFFSGLFTFKHGYGMSTCCKLFKLEILKSNNILFLSEREVMSEDTFFTMNFFPHVKKAITISEPLYFYCYRDNSISHTYDVKRQELIDVFLKKSLEFVQNKKLSNEITRAIIAKFHVFKLFAMTQIVESDLSSNDKKMFLNDMFKNKLLRQTLSFDVLALEKKSIAFFYVCLKFRLYSICYLLLKIKSKKNKRVSK